MAEFDLPETFDPNNLRHLAQLVDNLRAARCKVFKHPCGLELHLETRAPETPAKKKSDDWGDE